MIPTTRLLPRLWILPSLIALLAVAGQSGCAAARPPEANLELGPVGPAVAVQLTPTDQGVLTVYSDWVPVTGIDVDTHQHSDYRILRADGTLYRKVDNSGSPAEVALPAGTYIVDTSVSPYGKVRIPVTIVADRTTALCFTGELDAQFQRVPQQALVKLPDGRVVGWRTP